MRLLFLALFAGCSTSDSDPADTDLPVDTDLPEATPLRVATYNSALSMDTSGALAAAIAQPTEQVLNVARVIQATRPDVLLLQEFDYDPAALEAFAELLAVDHGPGAVVYPHRLAVPSNTGLPTGVDIDGDGRTDGPGDAHGYGLYQGHYAFAVLSRFPLDGLRSFRELRWMDFPDGHLPTHGDGSPWYSDEALQVLRLSSKSHAIVPVQTPDGRLHLVASHPTPPVFDGPEDRNGRRNHDEIGLVAALLGDAAWLVDDSGSSGGVPADAPFVVLGDLNADPNEGDSFEQAAQQVLTHARVHPDVAVGALVPKGEGRDDADTASWGLRVDYALPSTDTKVLGTGMYWPTDGDGAGWAGVSDHRLVWVDLTLR